MIKSDTCGGVASLWELEVAVVAGESGASMSDIFGVAGSDLGAGMVEGVDVSVVVVGGWMGGRCVGERGW